MDGWETRRKRIPGHDFCIVKLGLPGTVSSHHSFLEIGPSVSLSKVQITTFALSSLACREQWAHMILQPIAKLNPITWSWSMINDHRERAKKYKSIKNGTQVHGVELDTSFFTGNFTPRASVQVLKFLIKIFFLIKKTHSLWWWIISYESHDCQHVIKTYV